MSHAKKSPRHGPKRVARPTRFPLPKRSNSLDADGIGHYQDDLFVHNDHIRAHLADHRTLFERVREAQMVFSLRKSHFNYHRLWVLGHIITSSGRTPDPEKIAAVLDLKDPETDQ